MYYFSINYLRALIILQGHLFLSLFVSLFFLPCPTHINTYKDEHPHYSIISENFLERQFSYTKEELEGFIPLRKEGGSVHDAL